MFAEFLLLVANYKKALLSKVRRKTMHRHLKGAYSRNASGNRELSTEKLDDSGLTGKLFEQNSNLAEDTKFQVQVTFKYLSQKGCRASVLLLN